MAMLGGEYTPAALGNLWYLSSDPNLATFVGGACYAALTQDSARYGRYFLALPTKYAACELREAGQSRCRLLSRTNSSLG
jgi:hypothetical protein